MLNLALISRADWSQQGFSLEEVRVLVWSAPGCWLQEEVLDVRGLQSIFLSYVNKDLIFLGHFSCMWVMAIDWPVKNMFFFTPRGSQVECGTLEWAIHILAQTVCTRYLCTQTKPTNRTRTSPARSYTPNETKGEEMPRNQKPNGKSCPQKMVKWCPKIKSQMA